MSRVLALLAGLLLVLAVGAAASAAAPRASLPDIEDEVMCTQCGTPLNISESIVAEKERDHIRRLIAEGKTKDEIKADLVEEYGPRVLAVPTDGDFDFAAWLVPVLLGLFAVVGVGLAARRWRRQREPVAAVAAGAPPLDPEDARRLDAELAAFDR
ncbi:MAG TPA: cytochrome c-type biogenesis protein CcmH [Solirubrobacteraceae bacterium]|jgi:cytochrome c-type biogenesis protein CcmH/NrfF